jgi:hypothetical protein
MVKEKEEKGSRDGRQTLEDYFYAKTKRAAIRLFRLRLKAGLYYRELQYLR